MPSLLAAAALISVLATGLAVLFLPLILKIKSERTIANFSAALLVVPLILSIFLWHRNTILFNGSVAVDKLTVVLWCLLSIFGIFLIFNSASASFASAGKIAEYYTLILLTVFGLMVTVASQDFLVLFLGLEIAAVATYGLLYLRQETEASLEASIKYFLIGCFSSAIFVFGLALLMAQTQAVNFSVVRTLLVSPPGQNIAGLAGLMLILCSLAFKLALAPFHMWAPDVFEGTSTPMAMFISAGSKTAVLTVFIRFFTRYISEGSLTSVLVIALSLSIILSLVIGALTGLRQKNIQRLLAYSSISHSAFMFIAIVAGDASALLFYIITYILMTAGVFSCLVALDPLNSSSLNIEDLTGAGWRNPLISTAMTVFLLALAGFPPTAGFLAKFYVLLGAAKNGYAGLVIVAVVTSLISVAYYLKIVSHLFLKDSNQKLNFQPAMTHPALFLIIFLCLIAVFHLGIKPGNLLIFITQAVRSLF